MLDHGAEGWILASVEGKIRTEHHANVLPLVQEYPAQGATLPNRAGQYIYVKRIPPEGRKWGRGRWIEAEKRERANQEMVLRYDYLAKTIGQDPSRLAPCRLL